MGDKNQFIAKVGQCFSADSEQRAAAEQLVESQLT